MPLQANRPRPTNPERIQMVALGEPAISKSAVSAQMRHRQYIVGTGLLFIVVILWTLSNFVTQAVFEGGFEKPFLVTYLNTSSFTFYLIPFALQYYWRKYRGRNIETGYQQLPTEGGHADDEDHPSTPRAELPPLSARETVDLAFIFCLFWFIANWSVNASLNYTSVASATILSSMSGFFTMVIGHLFGAESLTLAKIGAVFTSFGGVVLVSLSDSSATLVSEPPGTTLPTHGSRPIFGDMLALLSAFFYAGYVVFLKVRIRSESRINMQLFFGFVGLFNVLLLWPIGLVLNWAGMETLEFPSTQKMVLAMLLNMAITLSSDYIYVIAMLKTTPLLVTVGLSLTIPLAVLGDLFLGKPASSQVIFGAVLVLISFAIVGIDDTRTANAELETSSTS